MSYIPKVIHYCWFGKNPLPPIALKCIESWMKYCPGYEINRWNEDNFDVDSIQYTKQAYQANKMAFVSDYARFEILYKHGGIYFDTDVELLRPIDDLIFEYGFMGFENLKGVAPGLGFAMKKKNSICKQLIDEYKKLSFLNPDGSNNYTTVVTITTDVLLQRGLILNNEKQLIEDIYIYPTEYFSPKNIDTKITNITQNTYSIHHYDGSWAEPYDKQAGERGVYLKKFLGNILGNFINILLYVCQKYGFFGCIKKIFRRKS